MFLGGQIQGDPEIEVRSPWDDELVGMVPNDSAGAVDHAVRQVSGYDRALTGEQRARILTSAAREIADREHELAHLITRESGICLKDSRKEIIRACGNLRVAAEESVRIRGESMEVVCGGIPRLAMTLPEPVGTVAAITPFNRPLNQVVVKVAPAIAMNNGIVVKPSEKAPLSAIELAAILHRAGLPDQMLAIVTGAPDEVGRALVTHPAVDLVSFTGSVETGEAVAQAAGLRRTLLELGGNDPLIVLADADLDRAARLAVAGAFGNAGQSCRGIKRIIAVAAIADELAERIVPLAEKLRYGDPLDPATDVGPLVSVGAATLVEDRCTAAVADGAQLLCGGSRDRGLLIPTVLDHVDPTSELVTRETFGPIAPIIRVDGVEAAIEVANSTVYGLQAGVVTDSYLEFMRIASELRVGAVALADGPNFDSPFLPFGGVKKSGVGREGIRYAMAEMSTVKTVLLPR
ncbi:MAG: aldehyde dehydrogenase family protein [Pseudonocardiaceae bacterium]